MCLRGEQQINYIRCNNWWNTWFDFVLKFNFDYCGKLYLQPLASPNLKISIHSLLTRFLTC